MYDFPIPRRSNALHLMLVLVVLMLFRAMLPAGYMPVGTADGPALAVCGGWSSNAASGSPVDANDADILGGAVEAPCGFAVANSAVVPFFAILVLLLLPRGSRVFGRPLPTLAIPRRPDSGLPPANGPPSPSDLSPAA